MCSPRVDQESLRRASDRFGRFEAPRSLARGSASFSRLVKPCLICSQIGLRLLFGAAETELLCSFFSSLSCLQAIRGRSFTDADLQVEVKINSKACLRVQNVGRSHYS